MSASLEVTFMYHCAFVIDPDKPYSDVLLSPAHAHAGMGTDQIEHIASLRIPGTCVDDDGEHPGREQETDTLRQWQPDGPLQVRTTMDVTWRLEGYDLWIDPPEPGREEDEQETGLSFPPPASNPGGLGVRGEAGPDEWRLARVEDLSSTHIDPRFVDGSAPPEFQRGGRVRAWGGSLACERPQRDLERRLWRFADGTKTGLSDTVRLSKPIEGRDRVKLKFRRFGDVRFRTVTLKPNEYGTIRVYIANDPTIDPRDVNVKDPCGELQHFDSYAFLLSPVANAAGGSALRKPEKVTPDGVKTTVLEGADLCCPCLGGGGGGGTP